MGDADSTSASDFAPDEGFFSVYETRKRIRIYDRWLAVPYRVFQGLFLVYVIGYLLICKMAFMQSADVDATPTFDVINPMKDYRRCLTQRAPFLDCQRPTSCEGEAAAEKDLDMTCREYDNAEVEVNHRGRSFFLAWSVELKEQHRCGTGSRPCAHSRQNWNTTWRQKYSVAEFEQFIIQVRHTFTSEALGSDLDAKLELGFLREASGRDMLLECIQPNSGCTKFQNPTWNVMNYPRCGQNDICVRTDYGDLLSVRRLFTAANTSLAEARRRSLAMVLQIVYTNMDPWDFWFQSGVGPTAKYTYVPRLVELGPQVEQETDVSISDIDRRLVFEKTGLRIFVQVSGDLGRLSLIKVSKCIGALFGLFAMGRVAIDMFLMFVYSRLRRTAHLHLLHSMIRYDDSPCGTEVQEALSREDPDMIGPCLKKLKSKAERRKLRNMGSLAEQQVYDMEDT